MNYAIKARLLIEKKLGRQLQPKEYIIIKDGNYKNIVIDNIELITPDDPRSIYYEENKPSPGSVELW